MLFDQSEFDIRCEWGLAGIARLAPISDAVIIVDVMSFTTCVTIAIAQGAIVYPYRWRDETSAAFAESVNGDLAGPRGKTQYSLSPESLLQIPAGTRLVLPSPNGSTLTLSTGSVATYAGCLRNSFAVAQAALAQGARIAVIPAGERWPEDNSLRPAFEDLIGAGAIIDYLPGSRSPEAQMAVDVFRAAKGDLLARLRKCASGKELISMGYGGDMGLYAQVDSDAYAPRLIDGAYQTERDDAACGCTGLPVPLR